MFENFIERRVSLAESEIHLRIGGEGPPLLLLHGFPQTHVAWHRVAPILMRRFTLVLPDLRGYGASRGPAPDPKHLGYSKRAMANDMAQLMTALGHRRFFLAGHDRGARVGFRLCLDHADRILRFAPIDIVPTLDVWETMNADRALASYHWQFLAVPAPVPERMISADPEFYIRHLLDRWAGNRAALEPRAVADYVDQFRNPSVVSAACEDYRAGATVDRAQDAEDRQKGRKIACPVLVLWGRGYLSSKTSSPLAIWQKWADDVREIALDCGHFVAEEVPETCAAALIEFFGDAGAHG
ncbi:MAG TPA: alpha/beta hydrolase [Stellaceae bacterium]|nr:alpha/beta hydrolase [Stellaceae bacterium]